MKKSLSAKVWLLCLAAVFLMVSAAAEGGMSLKLDETEASVNVQQSLKLTPELTGAEQGAKVKYVWETSDKTVATVSNGTVKGVAAGKAEITCTATVGEETLSASAMITVLQPVKSLKAAVRNLTLSVGDTVTPEITVTPANASNPSWILESSNPAVAEAHGTEITALAGGTAVITVVPADGSKASATISVYVPTLSGPEQTEYTMDAVGDLIIPMHYYGNDFAGNVQIKANNTGVTVTPEIEGTDLTLRIGAAKAGKATITVTDKKDSKAKKVFTINVTENAIPAARRITITKVQQNKDRIQIEVSYDKTWTRDRVSDVMMALVFYGPDGEVILPSDRSAEKYTDFAKVAVNYSGWGTTYRNGGLRRTYNYSAYKDTKLSRIDVAIVGYRLRDMVDFVQVPPVIFPESQWQWFSSSAKGYVDTPAITADYVLLDPEYASAKGQYFGHYSIGSAGGTYLYKAYAQAYGFHHSGIWVDQIQSSTWEKLYDLKPGDLIWGIDDILLADEPLYRTLFQNAYSGDNSRTVVLHVERDGTDFEVKVNRNDK